MSNAWINIEDDELVIDAIFDEELDKLYDNCIYIEDDNSGEYEEEENEDDNKEDPYPQRHVSFLDANNVIDVVRRYLTSKNLPSSSMFALNIVQRSMQK